MLFRRGWWRVAWVIPLGVVFVGGAGAASSSGTGLSASVSAKGHLANTFTWTIGKSASPGSQTVTVGSNGSVQWSITTTKSAAGTISAYFDGNVCVANTGRVATTGLAIGGQLTAPPSTTVLATATVDVSSKPQLAARASFCYPYTLAVPAASIASGATYKFTARVTITNMSGNLGTPSGPSPSATATLPTNATAANATVTVNDTNGRSFTFGAGGTQTYNQTYACPTADGAQTLTETNTATIAETGQTASATATIHCSSDPGKVQVTKTDDAGNALAGAEFTLYDDVAPVGGTRNDTNPDPSTGKKCTTDITGMCDLTDVTPGNYWLVETITPAHYDTAADEAITVGAGETVTKQITDKRKHRVVVVVCHEGTDTLLPSDVTIGGVTKQSLGAGSLSAVQQKALCDTGGASFGDISGHSTITADITPGTH